MKVIKHITLILLLLTGGAHIHGQNYPAESYEEVLVFIRVQGIGGTNLNAVFHYENERLYLPVSELFSFLKINYESGLHNTVINGFFVDEKRIYTINHTDRLIRIDGKDHLLEQEDILRTENGLFLHTAIFGKVFGLHCNFSFRAMAVEIKTDLELPAIRDLRLQQMRQNLAQLRGEVRTDTTLGRRYHLFRFGMLDWALSSTQISQSTTDNRFSLGLGMELLAGETNVFLNHSTRDGFDLRNQHYQWRWVGRENAPIRQIRAGKIASGSIASIYDPMHGVSVTNASTSFRRSFGEYHLADYTEPGWTVELFVNNVLLAYQIADASGYYAFDVPLVYGSSQVMLKFYGPYGEQRIREHLIHIPHNFLPPGELEYTVTGGVIQDAEHSRFARGILNYGINRYISLGGGLEYLSSIATGTTIPFATTSVTPITNLLITGEYAHGVRSRALFNYRLPSNLVAEFDYARYEKAQQAIRFNYLEERKATLNIPLSVIRLRGSLRFSYKQNVYELLKYNTAFATFSTVFGRMNVNLSGFASWVDDRSPYIYSNLTFGFRLPHNMTFRPQLQYDFTNHEIVAFKAEAEKRINRSGALLLSYQNNRLSDYQSLEFSLRWDLPFAQMNSAVRISNFDVTTIQGARGGISMDAGHGFVHADNRSSISRGGVFVEPYLDINHNGIRDAGEPMVYGLNVRINGGRILHDQRDTITRILDLEPYTAYLLELSDAGLGQIAWQLPMKTLRVFIDPNQFKRIEVPIRPAGEINGMVSLKEGNRTRGLGRVLVNIYTTDGGLITQVLSESDGYVTWLGLAPGSYNARIDAKQLEKIGMKATPDSISFEIHPLEIGDIVDGLVFELQRMDPEKIIATVGTSTEFPKDPLTPDDASKDTSSPEISESTAADPAIAPAQPEVRLTDSLRGSFDAISSFDPLRGTWFLQYGAFSKPSNVLQFIKTHENAFSGQPVGIVYQDGLYRIRIGHFSSSSEAANARRSIRNEGLKAFSGQRFYEAYYLETTPESDLGKVLETARKIGQTLGGDVVVIESNGMYRLRTGFAPTAEDAKSHRIELQQRGIQTTLTEL